MSDIVEFPLGFDPSKRLLPEDYEAREQGEDEPFILHDPTGYSIGEVSAANMSAFAAAMNKATGDLAYFRYQFEFAQKAMGMMLMAYVSRGSQVRQADMECAALEAVAEMSSGELQETAKAQLAKVTAEMSHG